MEYCCHIWAWAPACLLSLMDQVQKRIITLVGVELGTTLHPLSHRRSVVSLCLFYRYFHGKCSISLSNLAPPVRVFERETRLSACYHPYTVVVPRCRTKSYSSSIFPRTASLWNSLPGACFPSSYDLPSFKMNVNFYLHLGDDGDDRCSWKSRSRNYVDDREDEKTSTSKEKRSCSRKFIYEIKKKWEETLKESLKDYKSMSELNACTIKLYRHCSWEKRDNNH